MVIEVVRIERERSVWRTSNQLPHGCLEARLSISGEAHDFVLALVHGKTQKRGERRVQHPERMRKMDLAEHVERDRPVVMTFALRDGERCPLPHAVGGENRRPPSRRGQKGAGSVCVVMLREEDAFAGNAEARCDDPFHPDLLAERALHRVGEAAQDLGKERSAVIKIRSNFSIGFS